MRITNLPNIEISFPFRGERWVARLGDTGIPIEIILDAGRPHQIAAQLTSQLQQHGMSIHMIRAAVVGGHPLAVLLDRVIATKPRTKRVLKEQQ